MLAATDVTAITATPSPICTLRADAKNDAIAATSASAIHGSPSRTSPLREEGVPRLSQAPGFVAGQWVRLDEETGTSMLTFESEEAARAAAEMLRTNPPGGSAITINSIEVGEVVERA